MADERNPRAAPISTEFYSTHVESLGAALETLDVNDEQAKVKVEIDSSKVHWSELASSYEEGTAEWELKVAEENVSVFRSLQEKYPSGFFIDENDRGPNSTQRLPKWMIDDVEGTPHPWEIRFSSDKPFAVGGQAELFHAYVEHSDIDKKHELFVMKVFKKGTPFKDLLNLIPKTIVDDDQRCFTSLFYGHDNFNPIFGARLLKSNGQFAFLMRRAWGDLRKLIDIRKLHFNNHGPPFLNDVAFYIIHHIAKGMMGLHERDIIHRDLKTANILVHSPFKREQNCFHVIDPKHLQPHKFHCIVADFECSIGIVGTGFWRAPEILEAVKNRIDFQKPILFTKQADVYSFGMTCYEILSGRLPFEELPRNVYEGVISGARPMLPSQTPPWMVKLVNRCWHKDPSIRPQFEEIVKILEPHVPKEIRWWNSWWWTW